MTNNHNAFWKELPCPLRTFLLLNYFFIVLCAIAELICKFILHLRPPLYITPFLPERSPDFLNLWPRFAYLHQLRFFVDTSSLPFMYPAPMAFPYWFFFHLGHHALFFFHSFILFCIAIAAAFFCRTLVARGLAAKSAIFFVVSACVCFYPLWFLVKQANMEIVIWLLLVIALYCIFHRRPNTAAVLIGIATSIKIFPFVYLGIFFAQKRYRTILLSLATTILTTLIGLRFVYADIHRSWIETSRNLEHFRILYMLHIRDEMGWDHSLWSLVKKFIHHALGHEVTPTAQIQHLLTAYMVVCAIAGVALYFIRIRKMPLENQVIALTVASIVLPPVSFEYTLIHIYVPLALLSLLAVSAMHRSVRVYGLTAAFVCLAILSSPTAEFIYKHVTVGGQIKTLVLLVLFYLSLRYPFSEPIDGHLL